MFFIPGSQTRKRFYKKVSTVQSNKDFEIILDNRKLKTPAGSVFRVSSEPLALAVANEWDAQEEKILVLSMHLVSYVKSFLIIPTNLAYKFSFKYRHLLLTPSWIIPTNYENKILSVTFLPT